jgi:hypothetical protein
VLLFLCSTFSVACATSQVGVVGGETRREDKGQEMAHGLEVGLILDELIDAFKWGDEARARSLVFQLGRDPHEIRGVLADMLEDSYGLARQAAAFALGELGGEASVRLLERRLSIEEARGDYDGEAVDADIIQALGRIDEACVRPILVRKLEWMATGAARNPDALVLAHALWRRRHPELIPAVRQNIEQIKVPVPHVMHGLQVLLEMTPQELSAWARDPTVSVEYKTQVLVVLEEDVPDEMASTLPAFIAAAEALTEPDSEAVRYSERLFSLLLMDRERFLTKLPEESKVALRIVSLKLITKTFPAPSLRAAVMLEEVGRPEDAAVIEAHCPAEPSFAKVFIDVAQALRRLQRN